MRSLLIFLALAAAAALIAVVLGVFDPPLQDGTDGTTPADASLNGTDGEGATLAGGAPAQEPPLVRAPLQRAATVIMLSRRPTTPALFYSRSLHQTANVRYAVWYTDSDDVRDPKAGPGAGPQRGIELTDAPTADDLATHAVDVLVLDDVDPNVLPGSFWNAVTQRVAEGKLGLWVRPGFPVGASGESQTAHPALSHPALSALLPVEEAEPLAGDPVPGTFNQKGAALVLTDDGAKHPATRLSPYPKWARHTWRRRESGQGAWRPQFVYPVTSLKPGATSLVNVKVSPIEQRPAIAVSSPDVGRVLWQGNFDFGQRTYHDSSAIGPVGTWVHGVLYWLSHQ